MTRNEANAERARYIMKVYLERCKTDEDSETITSDILADFLHLNPELDLEAVAERARRYYEADIEADDDLEGITRIAIDHYETEVAREPQTDRNPQA